MNVNDRPYLQELQRWVESFVGFFPPDPETRTQLHWYTPLFGPACSASAIPPEAHKAMMQAAIDAAAYVRQAQPDALSYATVTVLIRLEDIRWTQVCVFYRPHAYAKFHQRNGEWNGWTPLDDARALSRECGLTLPDGFTEFGHLTVERSEDGPAQQGELWTIQAGYDDDHETDAASPPTVVLIEPPETP